MFLKRVAHLWPGVWFSALARVKQKLLFIDKLHLFLFTGWKTNYILTI